MSRLNGKEIDFIKKVYDNMEAIRVTERLPPFLIAGGFCRDIEMKSASPDAFKDLDIFISVPTGDELGADVLWLYAEKLKELIDPEFEQRIIPLDKNEHYPETQPDRDKFSEILNVMTGPDNHYIPVQMIGVKDGDFSDPMAYVEKLFDIGACMCYYNGTKVVLSEFAITDIKEKKFTIMNPSPNSEKRVKRFIDREEQIEKHLIDVKTKKAKNDWVFRVDWEAQPFIPFERADEIPE